MTCHVDKGSGAMNDEEALSDINKNLNGLYFSFHKNMPNKENLMLRPRD